MDVLVRSEQAGDLDAIRDVTDAAFAQAPHASGAESRIVDDLREAGALTLSMVAETAIGIIGHVAISPVVISDGSEAWFGLGPIAVAPEHQGKGVGTKLMSAALGALERRGAQGCVLVGDPGFYQRFGFRNHPELTYRGVPQEFFLALAFGAGLPAGTVTYHEAFATEQ